MFKNKEIIDRLIIPEDTIRALNFHLTYEDEDEWRDVEIDGVVYDTQTCRDQEGDTNEVTVTLYRTYMSEGFRCTDMNAEHGQFTYNVEEAFDLNDFIENN
jgi:hypothetical protein